MRSRGKIRERSSFHISNTHFEDYTEYHPMTLSSTTQLIIEYRYLILIPLALIEGPIVAFIAGTLASLGYFDVYFLAIFFLVRDVTMDSIYYALGYFGGRTKFVMRMLAKIKVTPDHLEGVRR